jgi:uncharacterized protein YlaN (UPF0358 family)
MAFNSALTSIFGFRRSVDFWIRLSLFSPAGRDGRGAPVRAEEWAWERIEVKAGF